MTRTYDITGRGDGHYYGAYAGDGPEDAVRRMLADEGHSYDPDMRMWCVREIAPTKSKRVLPTISIQNIVAWKPCKDTEMDYSESGIRHLFGRRDCVDALMVLEHPYIPSYDKIWLVLRAGALPEPVLNHLSCDFVERILALQEESVLREAIRIKRLWIDGEATYRELAIARDEAKTVSRGLRMVSRVADIEGPAAWAAARVAAWAAAREETRAEAWEAAIDIETERQIAKTVQRINEWKTK